MSKGIERCPQCSHTLASRSNGDGLCYLECDGCRYFEPVTRQPDPFPTIGAPELRFKCPRCQHKKVALLPRSDRNGSSPRRGAHCQKCDHRWFTRSLLVSLVPDEEDVFV